MAIPIYIDEFVPQEHLVMIITFIIAVTIINISFAVYINANNEKQIAKTPMKEKRNKKYDDTKECPCAPKAKRQRISTSPMINPAVSRNLFADYSIENSVKKCPDAPIKKCVKKVKSNKKQLKKVSVQLNYDMTNQENTIDVKLNDIRTKPFDNEILSIETITICSFYTPSYSVQKIIDNLNIDADTIDPSNSKRIKPKVNVNSIINYLFTLNRLIKNLRVLNENNTPLPHAGTGELTTRQDKEYFLIDKLSNASSNTQKINNQLANILNEEYNNHKTIWHKVPTSFISACKLCREVDILGDLLQREVTYNMNLTPWSEW